jgi:hypothetical protein
MELSELESSDVREGIPEKRKMGKLLVTAMLAATLGSTVIADEHTDLVHFAAHFGMGYAAQNIGYGLGKAFKMTKFEATLIGFGSAFFAHSIYKTVEGAPITDNIGRTMLGAGTSCLVIYSFDF